MDIRLIHLFNVALSTEHKLDPTKVAVEAAKRGYVVHPDCCTGSVLEYVRSREMNVNSTFYRTWKDVADKSRLELFVDQLLHYASTYGTNFEREVYCPNGEPIEINYKTYQVIMPATQRELFDRCMDMICSGIALSDDTLDALIAYIKKSVKKCGFKFDWDKIANRDAMVRLAVELDKFPDKGADIVRVLFFKLFNSTMPIMTQKVLYSLYRERVVAAKQVSLANLTEGQLVELSKVFLRYKKFLLAFKAYPKNRSIVNKIRRMAKKNHEPLVVGFWEKFTNNSNISQEEITNEIGKLDNNFKIVRLIQMIKARQIQNQSGSRRIYTIRNGKVWMDTYGKIAPYDANWGHVLSELLYKLCTNLSVKLKDVVHGGSEYPIYIKFPKNYELACPVSEKMFMGDIPFGTALKLANKDNYFGVYWKNKWGAHDFDLSFLYADGLKIGWNGDYYDKEHTMIYSGDMTSAEPEATEIILARGEVKIPDGCIKLNKYDGDEGSKYRLFFGQSECQGFGRNYMVDPNSISMQVDCAAGTNEAMLGFIHDNSFYFYKVDTGNRIVSQNDPQMIRSYIDISRSFLPLRLALLGAGAIEYTDVHAQNGIEPDIDLTNISRDTLIKLFS